MKKTALVIAIMFIVISSFGACSNNKNSTVSENNSITKTETTKKAETKHLKEVPDGFIGIYSVEDLLNAKLNKYANYILMTDLDLSSVANWEPFDNYGRFDGNNYNIENLKSSKGGLFHHSNIVCNLRLNNVQININENINEIKTGDDVISLGALSNFSGKVSKCNINGKIIVNVESEFYNTSIYVGGISRCLSASQESIETADLNISDCLCDIDIEVKANKIDSMSIGGIIEFSSSTITNCDYSGTIDLSVPDVADDIYVGGIVGSTTSERESINFNNCQCSGTVSINDTGKEHIQNLSIGGILGYNNKGEINIINSYDKGFSNNVKTGNIGGIIGMIDWYSSCKITNCYSLLNIPTNEKNSSMRAGAIIGYCEQDSSPDISYCCYNTKMGITSTNAMFPNCKGLNEEELKDIKNYIFSNKEEWTNTNSYPIYNSN